MGKRLVPPPQIQVLSELKNGTAGDDSLMNAAMMFNTFVRDGSSLDCDDDENRGFSRLF